MIKGKGISPFFNGGGFAGWSAEREATNPVISGTSILATQSYPPVVWYDEDDLKYYAYVGSTAAVIMAFSSDDGINWTEENEVLNVADPDVGLLYITPCLVIKSGATYHFYYMNNESPTLPDYVIKHATSTDPLGPYTPDGTIFFQASDYNSGVNSNKDWTFITDIVKDSGTYYWFGTAYDKSKIDVWYGTSNSLTTKPTAQSVLFRGLDPDYTKHFIQQPKVFKTDWGWAMTYTLGFQAEDYNERNIRSAKCTTALPTSFTPVNATMLNVGSPGEWDGKRVYGHYWLKKMNDDSFQDLVQISSQYACYYSGHNLAVDPSPNGGYTGLVFYDAIPDLTTAPSASAINFDVDAGVLAIPNGLIWFMADQHLYYSNELVESNRVYQVVNVYNKNSSLTSPDTERPTYLPSSINSLPSISFDGTQRLYYGNLNSTANPNLTPASFTIFAVVSVSDLSENRVVCGGLNSYGDNSSYINIIQVKTDGGVRCQCGDGVGYILTDTDSGGHVLIDVPVLITVKYQTGDGFITIYVNGVEVSSSELVSTCTTAANASDSYCIGQAGDYIAGNIFEGELPEQIHFERALNNSERETVEDYLMTKYNI